MNQFFFGYLSNAWKRLSRSIVYILLIINAFYVDYLYIGYFDFPSLPFEDLIYEYQSFIINGLFSWLDNRWHLSVYPLHGFLHRSFSISSVIVWKTMTKSFYLI